MELHYLVRGADGKQYGPVGLEQLSAWARERRIQANAEVKRSDMEYWAAAGDFAELQPAFVEFSGSAPLSKGAAPAALVGARKAPAALAPRLKSSASWFYWIAAFSLVNSLAAQSGTTWRFLIGLGITQIIDALGARLAGQAKTVVILLDLMVAALFVLLGVFANKAHLWAFIVGMVLFGLDGLLLVAFQDWLGVGFHVFVLFFLYRGLAACRAAARQ